MHTSYFSSWLMSLLVGQYFHVFCSFILRCDVEICTIPCSMRESPLRMMNHKLYCQDGGVPAWARGVRTSVHGLIQN